MKINEAGANVISCLERVYTNPWENTVMEGYYNVNNRQKGVRGEEIVEELLKQLGYEVKRRTNEGHDRIVNGIKTEIKFSAATDRNYNYEFTFNHIGLHKDWDEVIFCGVNGDLTVRMVRFNRETFPFEFFNVQQGGKNGGNDDHMCAGKRSTALLFNENAEVLF